MNLLEIVGAVVIGLLLLAISLLLCSMLWAYIQAAGGFIRASKVARRYGITLYKQGRKPRFFAVRMIHWQAWHCRNWAFSGLCVPWTFVEPIRRERTFYPA